MFFSSIWIITKDLISIVMQVICSWVVLSFKRVMPVVYFSHKLNSAQCNYTVGKKEILSIVETLKDYGAQAEVLTAQWNNLCGIDNLFIELTVKEKIARFKLFLQAHH
jgi:RNase H-like domain found in reverse transcriptase